MTPVWLFGYGSLMWDGWEARFGCLQRRPAIAPSHSRTFNKKSLERWGTHTRPGLTLNLTPSGSCHGVAFEFPAAGQTQIEDYLCEREICAVTDISVHLPGRTILARTYIYDGPRLVEDGLSPQQRAAMILDAEGIAGSSYDYIRCVRAHLVDLGVDDPAVEALWNAVVALKANRND